MAWLGFVVFLLAAYGVVIALAVADYRLKKWLRRERAEIIHAENRSGDRANPQPMVRLITSIQFLEPILVRSSRE